MVWNVHRRPGQVKYARSRVVVKDKRGILSVGALVVAVALVLAACGSATAPSSVAKHARGSAANHAQLTAASPGATAFRIGVDSWGGTVSYNPYSATGLLDGYANYIDLPLAFVTYRPPTSKGGYYYPELAQSWKTTKSTVTLNLEKRAKWQNGAAFTSKDVLDSLLIAGGDYNSLWGGITSVDTPGPHTVVIHLQSWAVAANVLTSVLQVSILPSSQWGSLIPSGFSSDLVSYWKTYNVLHPTLASESAAQHSSAGKVISKFAGKLSTFAPKTLIGDGPFKLVTATRSGALYKKWDGWWDAKAIRIPYVEIFPMDGETEYGGILNNRIDEEFDTEYTDPQVKVLNSSRFGHYFAVVPTPVQQASLVFHFATYPFGLLKVRQAFAYIIDRHTMDREVDGGTYVQEPEANYPDGMSLAEADKYVGKKRLATLNPYNHNTAKAAALLRSAGFTKRGGTWYTPKGKQFAFTLYEPAASAQFDTDGLTVAKMLDAFGIKATVKETEETAYYSQQAAGDYPVSENFLDFGTVNPISYIAGGLLGGLNYPVTYNGKGSCHCNVAVGIGPIANVPGLGKVNIESALNNELNTAPPSEWGKFAWDWVRYINKNLPFLGIYNNSFHVIYNSSRFSDFPPEKDAWMWTLSPIPAQPIVWEQQGFIKPRR